MLPTMPPHTRSILIAAALAVPAAVLAGGCGGSQHAAPPPAATAGAAQSTAPTLAQEMRQIVAAGSPGVITFVNDGHGVRLRAAGVADRRSGRALRPTDRFRAGSNTKSLVATVALQLVREGKLSLSDTVGKRLPGVLPYADGVTLRQLLNMTGGIPDYVPAFEATVVKDLHAAARSRSPRDLIAIVAGKRPDFAPGTSWNYSTTGYILAGMMIERATGHDLGDELRQRIFKPVRMSGTYYPGATTAIDGGYSRGYGEVEGRLRDLTAFNASAAWAGGGVVTTATDMARYWRALLGGKLLAPAQLHAMKTTVPVGKGYPGSYGLGIFRWTTPCGVMWGNGGDLPGFSSEFVNSEDGKVQAGVIVNVNPIPKAVSGEPLGATKTTAAANALGRAHC
jgi:D-alanyl-D-alanine carboxypeptidase